MLRPMASAAIGVAAEDRSATPIGPHLKELPDSLIVKWLHCLSTPAAPSGPTQPYVGDLQSGTAGEHFAALTDLLNGRM